MTEHTPDHLAVLQGPGGYLSPLHGRSFGQVEVAMTYRSRVIARMRGGFAGRALSGWRRRWHAHHHSTRGGVFVPSG